MYAELIRVRFLMMLAYRVNYYSGILIYSLNIGAYYFLWMAVFSGRESLQGFVPLQMATYIAVSWMARAFYFNNLDREIAAEIRDGTVAVQLLRPYNYLLTKVFLGFGEGLFRLLLFSIPGMILVSLVFPISLPTEPITWAKFALSLLLGFLVNVEINLITGLLAFFVLNNAGILRAKRFVVEILSGLIIPISFFPVWGQVVSQYLPFQAISYLPSVVLVKGLSGQEWIQALLTQGIWVLLLIVPIQLIWRRARKNLIVQGG
ncbi:ABC transporter permease [Risungbinella massiliensis]|uniref:ABC transporter permease n=1 Tax=Risungbinella massiliensis TaxID=1329796 RepID=UPI0005CBBD5D|nr:ABC-2 family transporter protein [Risungbinella massiliensis]